MVTATGLKALSPPLLALTAGAVTVPLVYPSLVGLALALLVLRRLLQLLAGNDAISHRILTPAHIVDDE
jgi:hypothetical protein